METYRVELINNSEYHKMMMGDDFQLVTKYVDANSVEEAIQIAEKNGEGWFHVYKKDRVKTIREANQEIIANLKKQYDWEAEQKRIKEAKEAKTAEKANAQGLTVEEYKENQKKQAKIKRYEREIKTLKEEVARMEREIARKEKALKEMKD